MARPRPAAVAAAVAVVAALLLAAPSPARAVRWPLDGYSPCGSAPLPGLPGVVTDMTFASDADIMWVATSGPAQVHRLRRSTGELLLSVLWDAAAYPSGEW